MANNLIQIKRSSTTATPTSLNPGELAYSNTSKVLFIGSTDGATVVPVAGARNPGVLTANQALVANSSSAIDSIIVANLVPTKIYAANGYGAAGDVLSIDSGGNVYWTSAGSLAVTPAGSNTDIQFNDSGSLGATGGMTFDKTTNTVTVSNTISTNNVLIGERLSANGGYGSAGYVLYSAGSGNTYWAAASAVVAGSNTDIQFNDSGSLGATAGLTFDKTSNTLYVANAVQTAYITGADGARNITTNYGSVDGAVGVSTDLIVGASTVGGNISTTATSTIKIGTTTINSTVYTGSANNASYLGGVGAGNYVNTSGSYTLSGIITHSSNVVLNGGLIANGSIGSAGYVLASNGTSVYWSNSIANATYATNAGTANNSSYLGGFAIANIETWISGNAATAYSNATSYADSAAGTAYANAVADATADIYANNGSFTGNNTFGGTNTVFNSNVAINGSILTNLVPSTNNTLTLGTANDRWKSLYISGNTIYIGNASISVDSSNNITFGGANAIIVNTATINTIAGSTTTISSNVVITGANVDATSALLRVRDATISGNLTINGTLTTVDTNNLTVKDSNIKLADQNNTTDTIDIGWYGVSGNSSATYYSGMVRKHDDPGAGLTTPVFTLFSSNVEPTGTVDETAPGYNTGTLYAYLNSSGLYTNSSVTNITANSTVSVALVANSLTLTTALAAIYGGTGQSSYSSGDLLVANTGNVLSKLSLSSTAGYVLQSNGTALVYASLDGGSF